MKWEKSEEKFAQIHENIASGKLEDGREFELSRTLTGGLMMNFDGDRYEVTVKDIIDNFFSKSHIQ